MSRLYNGYWCRVSTIHWWIIFVYFWLINCTWSSSAWQLLSVVENFVWYGSKIASDRTDTIQPLSFFPFRIPVSHHTYFSPCLFKSYSQGLSFILSLLLHYFHQFCCFCLVVPMSVCQRRCSYCNLKPLLTSANINALSTRLLSLLTGSLSMNLYVRVRNVSFLIYKTVCDYLSSVA